MESTLMEFQFLIQKLYVWTNLKFNKTVFSIESILPPLELHHQLTLMLRL